MTVTVGVEGRGLQDGEVMIEFAVRDSGIGIAPERLERLFKPFSQADSSTTRLYGGTGLGLAICRRLTEILGGQIWVDSRPGMGSTFAFAIPCEVEEGAAGAIPEPEPSRAPTESLQPLRILLAEDNSVNQRVALLMLEKLGYSADVAGNGLEVLAALHRQRYDLVFMDVQMPEMDGLEAARRIRSERIERPWIVAITANALRSDRDACLEAGMDDYLTKPLSLEDFRRALTRAGSRSRELADPAPAAPATVASPEPESEPPRLDPVYLERLRDLERHSGRQLVRPVVASFLEQVPQRLAEIRLALAEESWEVM
ncbi:MAG: response regulator, partial [Acidobacteriota bacterium]